MTIWSKLLPVGVADAVAGKARNTMPIERTARSQAISFRFGFRNTLKPSQLNISASLRYQRGIVPVLERGNRPFLTSVALRSSPSMTAWIEKNPDTLPRPLQFYRGVWSSLEKRY